jgi:hypothetical protein
MINTNFRFTPDETQFNKFHNLDSIETRIINYLKNTNTDDCNRLWKLLRYSDMKALYKDNLSATDKKNLIYQDHNEADCRVFTFPYIEDNFTEVCSVIKVYMYSVQPVNHLVSTVNIGIDILTHNKISNVYNDESDILDGGREVEENISTKNRNAVMLKAILATLNGADVEGVGVLQFNKELSDKCQAEMKLSNNRNFYGYTVVLSCQTSGIGGATNGFPSY